MRARHNAGWFRLSLASVVLGAGCVSSRGTTLTLQQRQAIEDIEVAGYPVPAGRVVSIAPYLLHRDPRWWPEAEMFKPERFEEQPPKYAYIPFGGGPRICIGNSFASMEARLLLATIAQRYKLRLNPGQQVRPEPLITLRPKNGLPMRLEGR